jgi:4-hydroxy-3-methylbut-2-en-1-yl diphosphate reductase
MQANLTHRRVILARPRGFCAGVVRAIDIVERALTLFEGQPVYVRHEIVHNRAVVDELSAKGAIFVSEIDQIPAGSATIFSAHGVASSVEAAAKCRDLDVIDATCPLVRKVHKEGRAYAEKGFDVILVGHRGHPEVEGTRGQIPGRLHIVGTSDEVATIDVADPNKVAFVTQTTLSIFDTQDVIAALRARFPAIVGPDTRNICYATQNRQKAVLDLAGQIDLLIVVGSGNSSNANRLRELGVNNGIASYLIDSPAKFDPAWLDGVTSIGVTAGASTPESLIQAVLARIESFGPVDVEIQDGHDENVHFRLPERLANVKPRAARPLETPLETLSS